LLNSWLRMYVHLKEVVIMKKFMCVLLSAASFTGLNAEPVTMASSVKIEQTESRDSLKDSVSKQFKEFVKGSKEMMVQYDGFVSLLQKAAKENNGISDKDIDKILNAVTYSAQCHQMQTRKNAKKTPYVSHPMTVAETVLTVGKVRDADVIIAALLHDTIDDTQATYEDIRSRFGSKVENIVRELTEDKTLSSAKRKKLQIIQAPNKSTGAAIICLSDQIFNLNNLLQDPPIDWTRERIDQYFQWVQSVVNHLPEANAPLKDEVNKIIKDYWKKQA